MKRLYISLFISMIVFTVQAQTFSGKWYTWIKSNDISGLLCYNFLNNNNFTMSLTASCDKENAIKMDLDVSISGTFEQSGKALTLVTDENTVKTNCNLSIIGELKKACEGNPQVMDKVKSMLPEIRRQIDVEFKKLMLLYASFGTYTQIAKVNENELHLINRNGKKECYTRKKETMEEFELKQQKTQEKEDAALKEDKIYYAGYVKEEPSFPGGEGALRDFISKNLRYPKFAKEKGIYGPVHVSFIVEKDGSLTDFIVTRSVDPSLDKEAIRVLQSMPKWNPGKLDGQFVTVKTGMSVSFDLYNIINN